MPPHVCTEHHGSGTCGGQLFTSWPTGKQRVPTGHWFLFLLFSLLTHSAKVGNGPALQGRQLLGSGSVLEVGRTGSLLSPEWRMPALGAVMTGSQGAAPGFACALGTGGMKRGRSSHQQMPARCLASPSPGCDTQKKQELQKEGVRRLLLRTSSV